MYIILQLYKSKEFTVKSFQIFSLVSGAIHALALFLVLFFASLILPYAPATSTFLFSKSFLSSPLSELRAHRDSFPLNTPHYNTTSPTRCVRKHV